MKGMIKGSNYSDTSSNVFSIITFIIYAQEKDRERERERERGREKRKNELGGERETRRTSGKRKAWIVTERAAAGLVIINSEKRIAVKARLPRRYLRIRTCLCARARARERGF